MNPHRLRHARDRRAPAPSPTRPISLEPLESRELFSVSVLPAVPGGTFGVSGQATIINDVMEIDLHAVTIDADGELTLDITAEDAHQPGAEEGAAGIQISIYPDLDDNGLLSDDEIALRPLADAYCPMYTDEQKSASVTGAITAGDYLIQVKVYDWVTVEIGDEPIYRTDYSIIGTLVAEPAVSPEIEVLGPMGVAIADGNDEVDWLDGTRFGVAETGETLERTFTIRNTGEGNLEIGDITTSAGFTVAEGLDATIAPGGSDTLTIAYDTASGNGSMGQFHIVTNDDDEATYSVLFRADVSATPPVLTIPTQLFGNIEDGDATPDILQGSHFMGVEAGSTASRTFTLRNDGADALEIHDIRLPDGYRVVGEAPTLIAGDSQASLTVELYAETLGTYAGEVVIINNDASVNPFNFAITGTVIEAEIPDPAISDFDGVGGNDLVFRWGAMGNTWAMNPETGATTALPRLVDANWKLAGVADFDGDEDADLLLRNSANGRIAIWRMSGATRVEALTLPAANGWKIGGVADFNADGQADIFLRHGVDGRNTIWTIDDARYSASTLTRRLANMSWIAAGAGDFDRDGKGDALFRNTLTGENAVWKFDGAAFDSVSNTVGLPDQSWQVADVKDFDGDGDADIIWRNKLTGRNAMWRMEHAERVSATNLAGFPNTNWLTPGQAELLPAAAKPPTLGWWQRKRLAEQAEGVKAVATDSLLAVEPLVTLASV